MDFELNSLSSFVTKTFTQRSCCKFVPVTQHASPLICHCGHDQLWHENRNIDVINHIHETWTVEESTSQAPTKAYGKIEMLGFPRNNITPKTKFIRLDPISTGMETLENFMIDYWKLPRPQLIISIIGGCRKMEPLSDELTTAVKRGIYLISTSLETWVFTNGLYNGVSRLIGQAAYEMPIRARTDDKTFTLIGMVPWGLVHNRRTLMNQTKDGVESLYHYYTNILGDPPDRQEILDPNHTALILVDEGRVEKFNTELDYRMNFEGHMVQQQRVLNVCPTMMVYMLIEGGRAALQLLREAIHTDFPIVVIKHSSRCADLLAYAVENKNTDSTLEEMQSLLSNILEERFKTWSFKEQELEQCIDTICQLAFQPEGKVHIYDVTSSGPLDKFMLGVILTAGFHLTLVQQLNLTMMMDRKDLAETLVFVKGKRNLLKEEDYFTAMDTALLNNQDDFVELLIREGLVVHQYLTPSRLFSLYYRITDIDFECRDSSIARMFLSKCIDLSQIKKRWLSWASRHQCRTPQESVFMQRIGTLVQTLSSRILSPFYKSEDFQLPEFCTHPMEDYNGEEIHDESPLLDVPTFEVKVVQGKKPKEESNKTQNVIYVPRVMEILSDHKYTWDNTDTLNAKGRKMVFYRKFPPVNILGLRVFTELDLFLWCVLLNRMKLARLFLRMGCDPISSCIVASTILTNLRNLAAAEGEVTLANSYETSASTFEAMAVDLLSEAYSCGKRRTHILLCRSLPQWDGHTCIALAYLSGSRLFLAQTACQTRLNRIWMGYMPSSMSVPKIIACTLLGPLFIREVFPDNPSVRYSTASRGQAKSNRTTDRGIEMGDNLRNLGYFEALKQFYSAPVTTFYLYAISYILILVVLAIFVTVELRPVECVYDITPLEWIIWVWCFAFIIEEVAQIMDEDQQFVPDRFKDWISSSWNKFDFLIVLSLTVSLVLRFTLPEEEFDFARASYAFLCGTFYLRFLQMYFADKRIGPKVIMVSKMVNDVIFFLLIYIVFILAYGVFLQAVLFPNQNLEWQLLPNIMYIPFWQTFGDLNLDYFQQSSENCTLANGTHCTRKSTIVLIAMSLYMVAVNILLVNLLIAMFGNTFSDVQATSETVWAFNRFGLVFEFQGKCNAPPPLNILPMLYHGLKRMCVSICRKSKKKIFISSAFKFYLPSHLDRKMSRFEQSCLQLSLEKDDQEVNNSSGMLTEVSHRLNKLMEQLQPLRHPNIHNTTTMAGKVYPNNTYSGDDLQELHVIQKRLVSSLGQEPSSAHPPEGDDP